MKTKHEPRQLILESNGTGIYCKYNNETTHDTEVELWGKLRCGDGEADGDDEAMDDVAERRAS